VKRASPGFGEQQRGAAASSDGGGGVEDVDVGGAERVEVVGEGALGVLVEVDGAG
jgi:hypothetical protein